MRVEIGCFLFSFFFSLFSCIVDPCSPSIVTWYDHCHEPNSLSGELRRVSDLLVPGDRLHEFFGGMLKRKAVVTSDMETVQAIFALTRLLLRVMRLHSKFSHLLICMSEFSKFALICVRTL